MSPLFEAVLLLGGYGIAALIFGLWLGERRTRIYIENVQTYGVANPTKKAEAFYDEMPEDRMESDIDKLTDSIPDADQRRLIREEDEKVQFDEKTVENGINFLLSEARSRGEQLSKAQARDEALRMLNAEGPEMP